MNSYPYWAKNFRKSITLLAHFILFCQVITTNCNAEVGVGIDYPPVLESFKASGSSGSETATPDLFTGSLSYNIPLEVQPGRNGINPNISLNYRNSNLNGWLGQGWELDLGSIQRSLRGGVKYNDNKYQLRMSGTSMDIVYVPSDSFYHVKIEQEFVKIDKLQAQDGQPYWQATDKKGMRYLYGQTSASRQDDTGIPSDPNHPVNPNNIFKWCLDKVIDPNGNYMTFTYVKNQGEIYLDRIDYTGNQVTGLAPSNYIKFYRESRTDASDIYALNFRVKTAFRLKTIDEFGNGNRIRTYSLEYQYSASGTGRSLLMSVTTFGKDAQVDTTTGTILNAATATKLPPIELGYGVAGTEFNQAKPLLMDKMDAYFFKSLSQDFQFPGDFNGDGILDFLYWGNAKWNLLKNDSEEFSEPIAWNQSLSENPYWWGNLPQLFHFTGDFNGDSKTDFMYWGANGWKVLLSGNDGFDPPVDWAPVNNAAYGITYATDYYIATSSAAVKHQLAQFTGDFNGDGKTDFMFWRANGWNVLTSNGHGFNPPIIWSPYILGTPAQGYFEPLSNLTYAFTIASSRRCHFTGDFNGDGKTDFMYRSFFEGWAILLSNGNGFESPAVWEPLNNTILTLPPFSYDYPLAKLHFTGDFNGDGKTDYLFWNSNGWNVLLSNGSRFEAPTVWAPSNNSNYGITCNIENVSQPLNFTGDFNNDGKTDLMFRGSNGWKVLISNGHGFNPPMDWAPLSDPTYGNTYGWVQDSNQNFHYVSDFSGDGKADFLYWGAHGWTLLAANGDYPDALISIMNGVGSKIDIQYKPSTKYQNTQLHFPVQTVSAVKTCDNYDRNSEICVGNSSVTDYTYSGGFFHIGEKEFRGFNYAKVTGPAGPDGERKIIETWFHQGDDTAVDANDPNDTVGALRGKPYRSRVSALAGGQTLTYSEVETTYVDLSTAGYFYNPPRQVDNYSCSGGVSGSCKGNSEGRHSQTFFDYDTYGNVIQEYQYDDLSDSLGDRTTIREFAYNTSAWIVGLPSTETSYVGPEPADTTKVSATTYYYDGVSDCSAASTNVIPQKGNITRIVRWNNSGANPETWAGYNNLGNPVCTKDANRNLNRITEYDSSYTYPKVSINALNQQMSTQYYDGTASDKGLYGQVKSVTDVNNTTTSYEYDKLGRNTKVTRDDGSWTGWSYNNFGTVGDQNVRTDTSAGLWSEEYFDGLGRTIKGRKIGPAGEPYGKVIVTDNEYDRRGNVSKTSLPYFEGDGILYTTFTYDSIGRVTETTSPKPDERVLTCYSEGVTVTIDPNNHRKRQSTDVYGRLIKVEEYRGAYTSCTTAVGTPYATTTYRYDVLGDLIYVRDAKNNETSISYDSLGRKASMSDPDMGYWWYQYDANGNLTMQTDAKGQKIKFGYDALNRLKTKDYGADNTAEITFTYDEPATNYYNVGHLTTMADQSGSTKYYYDKLGRINKTVKTIYGTTNTYTITTTYDGLDRIRTIKYPDDETVTYYYDGEYLVDVAGASNYATYTNYNALGQPGSVTFGNGVSTAYTYDKLDYRIKTIKTGKPAGSANHVYLSYTYNNNGNIASVTDSVNGTYPHTGIGQLYDPYPGKAHAFGVAGKSTVFDANGNLTQDGTRTITYNYDNMPQTINGAAVSFVYDGNGSRVKKVTPSYTVTYIDKLYECTSGGTCGKYIFAGNNRIALKNSSGVFYYHTDHLGSTVAVTNSSGAKVEGDFYLPFGETTANPVSGFTGVKHKYTSQELDSETGLYNYNARLYCPEVGRFLSADTFVPDPSNPQSLNRYAYTENNPLYYVDPSGNFAWAPILIGAFIGALSAGIQSDWDFKATMIGMGVGAVAGGVGGYVGGTVSNYFASGSAAGAIAGGAAGGAAAGATAGAMNAAIYGGNIAEGIFVGAGYGALGGAVFGGISAAYGNEWNFSRILIHGAAGGGMSELQGGSFGDGFAFAAGSALAMSGLKYATMKADASSMEGSGKHNYDSTGQYMRAGTRVCQGCPEENALVKAITMGLEGNKTNKIFGIPYNTDSSFGHFINWVGGPHDYLSLFMYTKGDYIYPGAFMHSVYNVYSLATMIPAAAFTGIAYSSMNYQPIMYLKR